MAFQIKLKDENLNNLTEANKKLKKQTAGLRQEVLKVESEINGKSSAIYALQQQIQFFKQQCSEVDNFKKEIEELKKRVEHLKNVQAIIDSSVLKVDDIIATTDDTSKLKTYITVLKRELLVSSEKSKQIRERYKNLQQQYTRVCNKNEFLSQESIKRKELEERLLICESEKISLQTKLFNMHTDAHQCNCNKVNTEKCESLNGQTIEELPELTKRRRSVEKLDNSFKLKNSDSCIIIDSDTSIENTPQSIKSQGFFSMRDHGMKRQKSSDNLKIPSTLVKKSRLNQPSQKSANGPVSFDGFGGHAKYDKFPDPTSSSIRLQIVKKRQDSKTRKPNLDTGDNKKISDVLTYYDDLIL